MDQRAVFCAVLAQTRPTASRWRCPLSGNGEITLNDQHGREADALATISKVHSWHNSEVGRRSAFEAQGAASKTAGALITVCRLTSARACENSGTAEVGTAITDKTTRGEVLSVMAVPLESVSQNHNRQLRARSSTNGREVISIDFTGRADTMRHQPAS